MVSSLQGVSDFLMKKTQSDEWGVYRLNLEKKPYLMLAFENIEEAVEIGQKIAKMFNKKCTINRSDI